MKMKVKLVYILLFFLSKIPIQILYITSHILQILNKGIIKYRLNITQKNLTLGLSKLTSKKRKDLINQFYHHFFNVIIEILKSISFNKKDIISRVNIKNKSAIENVLKDKKPIVLIGSHYGNWEWLLLRIGLIKNIKLSAVYRPLSNTIFDKILFKTRTKFGAELVTLKKWKYFILNKRNKPQTFLFISDQVPDKKEHGIRINFLNQSTLFHEGAEKTAKLLNAEVFYVDMTVERKGYYNIEFKKIKSKNITEQYANLLEKTIQKKPIAWLWSHNRWKR
jgi:KDO2-lipid IV(A) lauroyltransferase